MNIRIQRIAHDTAAQFVKNHHSYLPMIRGSVFNLGAFVDGKLIATATAAVPKNVSAMKNLDLDLARLCCTDETPFGIPSALIRRVARIAKLMGYRRLITFVRSDFPATSYRAANFKIVSPPKDKYELSVSRRDRHAKKLILDL